MNPYNPQASVSTRYLFFTGKGGVGKTSLSSATAVRLADEGKRVLLVSTDPASNLDEVLGVDLHGEPVDVPGVPGLKALNINPQEAAQAYRERVVGPLRGVLPEAALKNMEESLSGSCTVEIAAFDEFTGLIAGAQEEYDHVIFDTAPTGHTLRLMSLAGAWDQFLKNNTSGTSCLGPLAGLEKQRAIYEKTVQILGDAKLTTLVLVSRPQEGSLKEAERTSQELRQLGILNQQVVVNGVFLARQPGDSAAAAWQEKGRKALEGSQGWLGTLTVWQVPLQPKNVLGVEGLRSLLNGENGPLATRETRDNPAENFRSLREMIDDLERRGPGVILTMGKGGVGKTTLAAAIALELARRGNDVHLSTTDPAAHVQQAVSGSVSNLTLGRIDPVQETADYTREVMENAGAGMDEAGRALLEEDLRSPCTEEIAVFRAFAREVAKGSDRFVILDTAPTGHTLLLLDASQAYHRELGRQARESDSPEIVHLMSRLQDSDYTRILLVTLPEATPVHEAADLQEDLRRAGIEPFGWVVNQSLQMVETTDDLLLFRASSETRYLAEVVELSSSQPTLVPWQALDPAGVQGLSQLIQNHPKKTMPAYIYQTTGTSEPTHFEIEQEEGAPALTSHPESGVPIQRVLVDGQPLVKTAGCCEDEDDDSCCGGKTGCC